MQYSADLNNKMELWGMVDSENSVGEIERNPEKIKDVWCRIIPKNGKKSKFGNADIEEVTSTITIKTRKLSVKNPKIDMFFKKNGIKYKVVDFLEDFKTNSFWEFNCEVIYE